MPRARRGATLMETLVATAVAFLVIGGILAMFFSIQKMSSVADVAGSIQDAALAMFIIQKDLLQAVQKPDPKIDSAVMVSAKGVQLVRGDFKPDGSVGGTLVVYEKETTPGGNFRLRRRCGSESSLIPGRFRGFEFVQLKGPGGPFVRVTLRVATHDVAGAPSTSSEEAVLTSLVRLMGPEMLGSRAYTWSFLSGLGVISFLLGLLGLGGAP